MTPEEIAAHLRAFREMIDYNPDSGIFRWKISPAPKVSAGSVFGSSDGRGYLVTSIFGRSYKLHRLAWLFVHGRWPKDGIDHINRVRSDNRIANLRESNSAQNVQNIGLAHVKNKCGYPGIRRKKNRFIATIKVAGRAVYLGSFDSALDAHDAYMKGKRELHPFFVE